MPLTVGDKLGHYEITVPLGAGGMGEVYRARDTQLERDVAIKVLPRALAADPERLARFDREAKILAALNHPNVAVIHGVIGGMGESAGGRALVMELVEGETLADRLKRGPIPLVDSLRIAQQVAEAVEAAHEKGVVHRDLKPGNVMITPAGLVKVLDFGLAAMASAAASPSSEPENSPTLTMGMTQAGVIMGTAAYMSPEQAAGTPVDKRADIWSYGAVLWEMLSGARLFRGDTVAHTLASVLQGPILFESLTAPEPVQTLLRRCLDRDVRSRLRDIGEARIAIAKYLANPAASLPAPDHALPSRDRKGAVLSWSLTTLLFLLAATLSFLHFRETPPDLHAVNTTLLAPDGAEYDYSAPVALPALSPDGTRIVFGAKVKDGKQQLWLRRLDSPTAQPLPGTENAAAPFWDPTSRWIGFGQETKLKKIDIQGGPPIAIADITPPLRGGSWNTQGVILYATANSAGPVMRVAASGGTVAPASPANEGAARYVWFLPDGRHFLYIAAQAGDIPVRVGSLDQAAKPGKIVTQANSNAVYAQGHLLYLRDSTLMAQPFNPEKLETTGEPVPVAENIPTFTSPSRIAGFTVSPAGLLVYLTGASGGQSRLVWKDRQGKALDNVGEPKPVLVGVEISPDGKRAVTVGRDLTSSNTTDLWIYDLARGIPTRFTFDPKTDRDPVWSPDGATIYFASDRQGYFSLYRKPSNSAAEELLLQDSAHRPEVPSSVSPDGKLLLYTSSASGPSSLWVLSLTGKPEPRVYLQAPPFGIGNGRFSPDGHWVAYQSNESGQNQIYAAPFPGPGGKRQISVAGGRYPRWRRDGKEIFYVSLESELMAAEVDARNGTLEVGRVQKLFDGIVTGRLTTYDAASDGQKFLIVDEAAQSARPLTLLQNWTATLRK